ncbi:MAG: hypothetical protein EZS28_006197 [Streblomastix strix]|uniref:Uncharacterized protein n=1 Tax=Streblomastix strix TaxID=222440 RepID=A0A5J4WT10_9EUKA|nr:MAG: hypothetical protein EZS28_006197 [Streblomastix strix]
MGTHARAQSPIVFDELMTLRNGRTYQGDHTSQDYQTSVMEWMDSLTYTPKYTNQYPKQQKTQSRSQHNKSQNQKQKAKTKNNQQIKQSESQLMEQTTMKTVTNLSSQLNPTISQTETMISERMTAGRSYRPLSTEKRIPRSISQKHPPTLHLTMQTDQMDSEETVVGRSYRQQPTQMDTKTIRQSITLAMKTITNKQMIIESEDNNKTIKDLATKFNTNRIVQIINQRKQDHPTQPIPNKNQEIQTLLNPKVNLLQSPHLQKQVKQKEKLQYLNRRPNKLMNTKLEAKQVNQSPYRISPQGVPKLEPTPTLLTTSHYSRSREKRQMQPQLLKTSPQNAPKATRPVQDPRNRNKDLTPKTRQKQSAIPRPTSQISWTEEERDQERRDGRDLENREIDKENREILDKNGRINNEIFGLMGNNQHERLYPIRIYPPVERQLKYQQPITLIKDNEIQGNR